MRALNIQTEESKYLWMDGEYQIYFPNKECAEQYQFYHGGVIFPILSYLAY